LEAVCATNQYGVSGTQQKIDFMGGTGRIDTIFVSPPSGRRSPILAGGSEVRVSATFWGTDGYA